MADTFDLRFLARRSVAAIALLLGLVACHGQEGPKAETQAPVATPDPFRLPDSDPRIVAAKVMSNASISGFVDALRTPNLAFSGFAVRAAIAEGAATESLWVGDVTWDGHVFKG